MRPDAIERDRASLCWAILLASPSPHRGSPHFPVGLGQLLGMSHARRDMPEG
jgi:hypothetical protein